jgi:hypothetical protein
MHVLGSALFVGLGLALAATSGLAQVVHGEVRDAVTGQPIAGAQLRLLGQVPGRAASGRTGNDGQFSLAAPGPGDYQLRCEMPGYRLVVLGVIRLADGQRVEQTISLAPLPPMTLDTVLVAGERVPAHLLDFHRRRADGLGAQFLTREEFQRWNPSEATHIVQRLSGFVIRRNHCGLGGGFTTSCRRGVRWIIESRRGQRCAPLVVVDGVSMGTTDDRDLNDLLWVENLDAVEAYTGAAQLPSELNVTGSACGVLVFWTKH